MTVQGIAILVRTVIVGSIVASAAGMPAAAQPSVADFYRGRTITFLVGSGEGGGFDLSARLAAQFLGRFIPGNPAIVVQNMPGASGLRAAEYVYAVAPRDGSVVCITQPSMVLHKVLNPQARFNPAEYTWVGRLASFTTYGLVWRTAPVQTMEEAKTKTAVLGAVGPSGPGAMLPTALNKLAGTKFTVVKGYKSASELGLAMERGELHGSGSSAFEYVYRKGWVDKKLITFLFTIGLQRNPNVPDAPTVVELVPDARDKRIIGLAASASDIGRSIIAPPGVPAERADALRRAFGEMVKDRDFIAEAARRRLDFDPLPAEDIHKIVAEDMATPADVVDVARKVLEGDK
jgi:tripartite-type tricarboxylate transporter receptor subunit TctC